ncbi:MAG: sortase [Clostridia bacterium]|nr:sortase [Clostridia bacterium]
MKRWGKAFIILAIIIILGYTSYKIYKEAIIKDYKENKQVELQEAIQEEKEEEKLQYLGVIPELYKGYKIAAKLEIPTIDVTTYVLEEYSKPAMELAVSKYYGTEPNEIGNYCIAGHNYIRKNMFSELGKLQIGDKFILTDNWHGEVSYQIYDKYKAFPTQTQSLSQKTNGEIEVTLITCCDYSKKRMIIKARSI